MKIEEYIKERMVGLNLNQSELARKSGVDRTYINKIVNGRETGTPSILKRIFKILGTPDYLTDTTTVETSYERIY